ncbi:MAG: ATP-dependent DNA helicase RecG [Candidatus Yonathbacteria bacterium]|nr:ATP-dependent DNA helicase RecG [Candidatus Yonathbacteria bacterium]
MTPEQRKPISPADPIDMHIRMSEPQKKALAKMGVVTVRDMLYHFPSRYHHIASMKRIADLAAGDEAVVYGKVISAKTSKAYKKKIPIGEITIDDGTGKMKAVWFHQAFAAAVIKEGTYVKLAGRVQQKKTGELYLGNPEFEKTRELPIDVGNSLFAEGGEEVFAAPVYAESKGVSSRFIAHAIERLFGRGALDGVTDAIPDDILKRYNLPTLATALVWIHTPQKEADARAARKRFAFEEIFFIQLARQRARRTYRELEAFDIDTDRAALAPFLKKFSFPLTGAQERAIDAILSDMGSGEPMTRLLEGDVGSGKTAVAAATAYGVVSTRPKGQDFGTLQVAYMAPTEILATQHFLSFIEYFRNTPIQVGLITGSGCKKFPSKNDPDKPTDISRAQLLKWVVSGEIAILFGTHALIQKSVKFKHLAYAIIDEQHRFGTNQRSKLAGRDDDPRVPHLLSMTATPIPRTLALTIYGDLDLTLLDELPAGRKEVITEIVPPDERDDVYAHMRAVLDAGRQAYVICPRIDEPDPEKSAALNMKSVKTEAERLKRNVFVDKTIEILHSKMTPKEKDATMARFAAGETDILVATSVVEVGVNVPNATEIIIEGAERFGLAQLHQLRGRVQRSSYQAYCHLFTDSGAVSAAERLKAFAKARDGFALAEMDLSIRGSGELGGGKQWGVTDVGMEAIKNLPMVEAARHEAMRMLDEDPAFVGHPLIAKRVAEADGMHFE